MCGNKGNTQSTSTVGPPPGVANAYNATLSQASNVAATPYTPYSGQRVADFSNDQTNAFQDVRNNQGIASPYIGQAAQYAAQGASPVTDADIQSTLNSTGLNQQVSALTNLYNQQNATANSTVTGNAASQGALGGDRVGVAQALTQQANTLAQAPSLANAYNTAYGQASNLATQNKAAQANAAYAYGNLGQEAQNTSTADANALLATGGLQQQQAQNQLNVPYQDYLTQQAYPFQTTQWLAGIQGALGSQLGSTTTSQQPQPSIWSQLLGLGAAGTGAYLASDERVKENIAPVGQMFDGTPIYRYNMAGQPATQIGVMAQDLEQSNPAAVAQDPRTGIKMVDYDVATRPALKAATGGLGDGYANGGSVDPDFHDMTSRLTHAIGKIRATLPPHMANGGIASPIPIQAQPLNIGQVAPESIVPTSQMGGGHVMSSSPGMGGSSQNNGMSQDMSMLGKGIGSYLSKPSAPLSVDPGTAMNGGWTTTTPPSSGGFWGGLGFADGGDVPSLWGDAIDTAPIPLVAPGPRAGFSAAPQGSQANSEPIIKNGIGVNFDGGIGSDATTPFSNNVQAEKIVPDAPLPPQATPYGPPDTGTVPVVSGSADVAPTSADQSQQQGMVDPAKADNGKSWYEYGSNPGIGTALMAAGFGMMGGDSPYAGVNIGRGAIGGLNTYLQQKSAEREYGIKQEDIRRQAEALAVQAQRESEMERHNQATEATAAANVPKYAMDPFGRPYNVRTGDFKEGSQGGAGGAGAPDLPTGDEFLQKYVPPQLRAQVKAIASYDGAPPTGIKGQALLDMVHQYNPNYSQNNYPAATRVKVDFSQAGQTGKALAASARAVRHMSTMNDAFTDLQNYQGPASTAVNYGRSIWKDDVQSDPVYQKALSKFNFAKEALATELDKAFKGTGSPDVSGIEGIKKNFSPYASPADFAGAIASATELLHGSFDGANTSWKNTVGSDYPHPLMDEKTQATFDKLSKAGKAYSRNEEPEAAPEPKTMTADEIRNAPDGHSVVINGQKYTKQGMKLVPEEAAP